MGTHGNWDCLEGKFPPRQPPRERQHLELPSPGTEHFHIFQLSSGTADNPAAHTGLQTPPKHLLGPQPPRNVGVSMLSCPRVHPDLDFNHDIESQSLLLLTTFPACSCWIPCSSQGQPCQPHLILPFCLTPRRGAEKAKYCTAPAALKNVSCLSCSVNSPLPA